MALNKQIHSFLAISKAFLKHTGEWLTGDSFSADADREADETAAAAYAHGGVAGERRDPMQ